jgi:hypothetical protein
MYDDEGKSKKTCIFVLEKRRNRIFDILKVINGEIGIFDGFRCYGTGCE